MELVKKPWGWYSTLDNGHDYKVKKIFVKGRHRFSLQYHGFREEHWIVVKGSGILTQGKKETVVNPGDNFYIPIGGIHRLTGGKEGVMFIEVQRGVCREDDIVRIEDDYGRI